MNGRIKRCIVWNARGRSRVLITALLMTLSVIIVENQRSSQNQSTESTSAVGAWGSMIQRASSFGMIVVFSLAQLREMLDWSVQGVSVKFHCWNLLIAKIPFSARSAIVPTHGVGISSNTSASQFPRTVILDRPPSHVGIVGSPSTLGTISVFIAKVESVTLPQSAVKSVVCRNNWIAAWE